MKQLLLSILLISLSGALRAQSSAEVVAGKISNKMKDSLSLTDVQKDSIYANSVRLHAERDSVIKTHWNSGQLQSLLDELERRRDDAYQAIINDFQKYRKYRYYKDILVSNN